MIVQGATQEEIRQFAEIVSRQEHIVRVQSTNGLTIDGETNSAAGVQFSSYKEQDYQRIVAITNIDSRSTNGYNLITKLRDLNPMGDRLLIGGSSAVYTDAMLGIQNNLLKAIIWVIVSTLILIFLFTGSIVLPIKAVILNLLSLSATLGFITWVFQDGNLQWLTGPFQITGTIDSSTMVLVAIIAFGLSMDYELFLLSRIKEQHELGKNTVDSVSIGLQRSGRLITTAALVLAVSFIAFVTGNVSITKMLGLGIAFAILLDAIVVRALLVPALMRLFGDFNWWAPRWLKTIHRKISLDH
jgi:RND superfamily putative drug exporter